MRPLCPQLRPACFLYPPDPKQRSLLPLANQGGSHVTFTKTSTAIAFADLFASTPQRLGVANRGRSFGHSSQAVCEPMEALHRIVGVCSG